MRELSAQGLRHAGRRDVTAHVACERSLLAMQPTCQCAPAGFRERRATVLVPFPTPDQHLAAIEVHILYAEADALAHAQPAAVHERDAQTRRILEAREDRPH